MQNSLVQMEGIEKRFPGVHALNQCRFELLAGEIHALVGENGAGKIYHDENPYRRLSKGRRHDSV